MAIITRRTRVDEIVDKYPQLIPVLERYNIYCYGWGGRPSKAPLESQAWLVEYLGYNLDNVIAELNNILDEDGVRPMA